MSLAIPQPAVRLRTAVAPRWLATAAVLGGCALFLFAGARTAPIVLWDESRNAVNALEMHQRGFSLVTTYGFHPDTWNTKPPLLIWLQWLAMAAFGPSEWAVRLPSALAATGTLALTLSFTRRLTGSSWSAALAAVLLATSYEFFAEFGARTGDYDALLCLFTTAYLYVLFFAVHRRKPGAGRLALAGTLIAGAVLTKSVMGLVPGAGVALYLLVSGRWMRLLRSPGYGLMVLVAAAPVAAFLLLREHQAAGYLKAVAANDLGGRFGATVEGHTGPPWFYLETTFVLGFFSCGWLAALSPAALAIAHGRIRQGLTFCLCVTAAVLLVLGLSATKLNHYASGAYPFIAMAAALAVHAGFEALQRAAARHKEAWPAIPIARIVVAVVVLLTGANALRLRTVVVPAVEFTPQGLYGELFRSLQQRGLTSLAVVDGGERTPSGTAVPGTPDGYAPRLRFYTLLAREKGMQVQRIAPAQLASIPSSELVATCDPALRASVRSLGSELSQTPGCVAVRAHGAKGGPERR